MSKTLQFESFIPCSLQAIWSFHTDVQALITLTPPPGLVKIIGKESRVVNGAIHNLKIRNWPISIRWDAEISDVRPPEPNQKNAGFVDTAIKSPFAFWRHRHEFVEVSGGVLLVDQVEYAIPLEKLTRHILGSLFNRQILEMFTYRHNVTYQELANQVKIYG